MLVQRNCARTMQPARPVLQTEITNVCAFSDLLVMTVKWVRNIVINSTSYNKESPFETAFVKLTCTPI